MEGPKGDDIVKVASNVIRKPPPLIPISGLVPIKNFGPFDKQKDGEVQQSNESEPNGRKIETDNIDSSTSSNVSSGIKLQIKKNAAATEPKPDEDNDEVVEEIDGDDDDDEPQAPPYSDIDESSGGDEDNSFDDEEETEPKRKKLKMDKDVEVISNLEMDEESNSNNKSNSNLSVEEVSSKMTDIVNKVKIKQKIVKSNEVEVSLKGKLAKNPKSNEVKPKKKQIAKDNKVVGKSLNIDESDESRDPSDSRGSKVDNEKDEEGNEDSNDNDGTRRTKRKRKPTKPFEIIPRLKVKRKKGKDSKVADEDDVKIKKEKVDIANSSSEFSGVRPKSGRGSRGGKIPGASGRGRGRPKGPGTPVRVRVKVEKKEKQEKKEKKEKKVKKGDNSVKLNDSTSSIETFASPSTPTQVTVKEEIDDESEATPSGTSASEDSPIRGGLKPRGRGSRGPRLSRGSTGSTRGSRGGAVRKLKLKEKIKAKKEKKEKKIKPPPQKKAPLQVFEEETRMSADIKPINGDVQILLQDEESQSNSNSTNTNTPKVKKFSKDNIEERKPVTAENLYEYSWPPDDRNARLYILQEQITEYLDVKSFKRKYPDLERRIVEMHERDFLRQNKIVSETQATQGLTALRSSDVLDIMSNDFPDKYEEFIKTLEQRVEKERQKSIPQVAPPPRDRTAEFMRRIMKSCSKWNSQLNVERKEDRSCSFDLQTYTLHYPKGKMKVLPKESTQISHYPVALLPGQYCDNYKDYTSTELKYLPLNTVIYGPLLAHEEMRPRSSCDDSDDSSDSDSDSSSDSSSSSSSSSSRDVSRDEMDVDNEGNRNGIDGSEEPKRYQRCKRCDGDHTQNKIGIPEVLINCGKCDVSNHPTCLELSLDMLPFIKKYNWQCTDCKNCNICEDPADEDKMLFCDLCDRGYHIYCVGLRKVPTGKWHCRICDSSFYCNSCGSKEPGDQSDDQWHHEYKKSDKGLKFFSHSHCSSCHKLFRKGVYCPGCLKVHISLEESKNNMRKCRTCEKWVHKECIKKTQQVGAFGFMCENCTKSNVMSMNQKYTP